METVGIPAASWVVGKALSPLSGGVLEAWGASSMLGSNMKALKMQLLYAQGMLNNVRGREIQNPALAELLDMLRQLAYGAEDVLDELDYFRIQDELDSTYHAADVHAAGLVQDLALNARHTARACVNKLKLPVCSRPATDDEQDGDCKQGYLSGLHFCGRREISSSPSSSSNQLVKEVHGGCMPKVASSAREASQAVGKHFPCYYFPSVHDDDPDTRILESSIMPGNGQRFLCGAWLPSKAPPRNHGTQAPKLKFDRVGMSTKIRDIAELLKPVCAMVSTILNLELVGINHTSGQETATNRAKTSPEIIEPKLYGRDSQKEIIVDKIVKSEFHELTVLPIVGPGGIGKTTFTQHIYEQMKSRFQVPIWICVSFDFNGNRLAKDIVKKIPEVHNENKNCSDEELIRQRIKGKRVLLVLDDVWAHHEDEWKKLIGLFTKDGAKGNMVIVTTRIPMVANMVKTTKCSLELEHLCPKDIMSLFEECVFGDQKPWVDHPELTEVGSKIVDKLKGSPLAAKTVGRLLRNKLTLNHWTSVLASKEWESQTNENDIMPALKLSYDYLPFHLQQCFSFCGLFPQDYEFGSEELVHLWIGLDILHSCDQKRKRIEDVGLCHLNELVNHGFFKIIKREDERPYYVIHDFLHELAVKVSSYECLSICSSNVRYIQIPPSVRHLSIIIENTDVKDRMSFVEYDGNLSALHKRLNVGNLRTLMIFGDYHGSFAKTFGRFFREAIALRVIFFCETSYNLEDIFPNFSKLIHLRYLRIKSENYYRGLCLPSALFRLYHLEVLDLQSVYCIGSTRNMSNLVKLHHFLVSKYEPQLHSDIFDVRKLKFLHELREFRVRKESTGFEPSQLGQLAEIGGSLGLYNLENVQTKEEANEIKLIHKKHLKELILDWDAGCSNNDHIQEGNILENLVPHSDLQGLCVKGQGGSRCPSWLCTDLSVKSLESLCLDGVSWKNLPPLGEMWMVDEHGEEYPGCSISDPSFYNLKRLELSNISLLKKWVGNGACPIFSHLEVLIIKNCSKLTELPFSLPTFCEAQQKEKMAWFPRLRELVIENCPKLVSLPPIPWRIHARCSAKIVGAGSGFARLVYARENAPGLRMEVLGKDGHGDVLWNGLNFSNLTEVEYLHMDRCPPLPLDHMGVLTSLKGITIWGTSSILPRVQGVGHGIYQFPCADFSISGCDTSGEELTLLLSFFPELSTLTIEHIKNITRLGVAENAETSLEEQQQTRGDNKEIITAAAASQGLLLLPPKIQRLRISFCFSNPPNDDHAGGGGIQRLHSLRALSIICCPEFFPSISFSSLPPFPTCLQHLTLWEVKHMETLHAISNLTYLTELRILGGRESRAEGLWPLLAHGRLTNFDLGTISGFFTGPDPSRPHDTEVFSRSSKLLYLSTRNTTGVLAAPICSLLSSTLTTLHLSFDHEVERLTKEQEEAFQILTSLQELEFSYGVKLQRLPAGLHKLINLKMLRIYGCVSIWSLPSLPSSLQKLVIISCGAIKSLPKDGLPSSMLELDVRHDVNEDLKRECRKLIGTIPIVIA